MPVQGSFAMVNLVCVLRVVISASNHSTPKRETSVVQSEHKAFPSHLAFIMSFLCHCSHRGSDGEMAALSSGDSIITNCRLEKTVLMRGRSAHCSLLFSSVFGEFRADWGWSSRLKAELAVTHGGSSRCRRDTSPHRHKLRPKLIPVIAAVRPSFLSALSYTSLF